MNRVFKTKWSAAHQQYVVTDEHHATKGKSSKSAVALAVSALMLAAGSASALAPWTHTAGQRRISESCGCIGTS